MRLDQKEPVIFYVKQEHDKKWIVTKNKFEKPIAYFTRQEHAKNYAHEMADAKEGSKVIIDD